MNKKNKGIRIMKKRSLFLMLLIISLFANTCFAASVDNSILFTPTLTIALKIQDWFSSGINRALLAFTLGANAADDAVLGRADVLYAFMQNPVFVGKDASSDNLIAATLTEKEYIFIYYSPTLGQAYVMTHPYDSGITFGTVTLEGAVSSVCSKYYRVTDDEMASCINYIRSVLQ